MVDLETGHKVQIHTGWDPSPLQATMHARRVIKSHQFTYWNVVGEHLKLQTDSDPSSGLTYSTPVAQSYPPGSNLDLYHSKIKLRTGLVFIVNPTYYGTLTENSTNIAM